MPEPLALAVDLGGTKVEAALVDGSGNLIEGSRFRRPTGAAGSSQELAESVRAVVVGSLGVAPLSAPIAGVGVGSAGPIELGQGLVSPLNLPAWRDFPLVDLISEATGELPVTLRMDGLCITLAEHWVGAAQNASNLMGMVVSTGVGGGIILGGHAIPGSTGNAGHIGHVEVAGFDDPCACGGRGCLEAIASGPSSVAWARSQGWVGSRGEDLSAGVLKGDKIANAAIARAGRAIGSAIGSAASLLDLDIVAIGGGFSRVAPEIFDHIRAAVDAHSSFSFSRKVRVLPSALSDGGPLIGAAALVHRSELLDTDASPR